MAMRLDVTINLIEREPELLPFVQPLLTRWMALDFEPGACRRLLAEVIANGAGGANEALLVASAVTDGGLVARESLLYPALDRRIRINHFGHAAPTSVDCAIREEDVPRLAEVMRDRASNGWPAMLPIPSSLGRLPQWHVPEDRAFGPIDTPGLYRREHGCVVVRSKTTTVMMDPVSTWIPGVPRAPVKVAGGLDAILITHGHPDHFNVSSILAQARDSNMPVIVPQVARPSLLSPNDMASTLRLFGQHVIAPAWNSRLRIGDIDIDVLPFYGEQPVKDADDSAGESPEGLRNWGNCYGLSTPESTVLALIDSGIDPAGSMVDVVGRWSDDNGPADFLMSSLPRFHCPFFLGLPHYYLALPFARLNRLYGLYKRGELPSVTPGPDGIVDICRAGRPRYYLPYGNGFEGIGRPIVDVGIRMGEPSEARIADYLTDRFAGEGIVTRVLRWHCGDHVAIVAGDVSHHATASTPAWSA